MADYSDLHSGGCRCSGAVSVGYSPQYSPEGDMPGLFPLGLCPPGTVEYGARNPENSLPAFKKAVDHGFAIELDVHLTSDGQIVVFHDDTLKRMCQLDQSVESMTYDELSRYRLMNTDCRIPLLTEVLKLVNGRVPLLIELKLPTSSTALCPLLDRLLASYPGQYLIESLILWDCAGTESTVRIFSGGSWPAVIRRPKDSPLC